MNNPADTLATLAPCPFCGGAASMYEPTCNRSTPYNPADRAFPVVRCGCGAQIGGRDWDQRGTSAIAAWNRRASLKGEAEPVAVRWRGPNGGWCYASVESALTLADAEPLYTTPPAPQAVGEAVDVIVGELISFATHIATCHSNRDGTVTLPPSVKSVAAGLVERCNLSPMVYTAPPPQQAGERAQDGVAGLPAGWKLKYDAPTENVAGKFSGSWTFTSPENRIGGGIYRRACYDSALIADAVLIRLAEDLTAAIVTHPTPSPAPQGGGECQHDEWDTSSNGKGYVCAECGEYMKDCEPDFATPPAQQPGEGVTDAMVERAASILWSRCRLGSWSEASSYQKNAYIDDARAALTAALAPKEKGNG